jgi:hypothetical protein
MEAIETIKNNELTANIFIDENPDNPLNWGSFYGKFIFFHKSYNLGHTHNINHRDYSSWGEMKEDIIKQYKTDIILPLYLYDHSGITISTTPFGDRWDSGQVGFVVLDKKQMQEINGWKKVTPERREQLFKYLENEVETYDQYITGDVYGYSVEDKNGNVVDSCWGFYGMDSVMDEVNSILK